jgi:antitoxin component HigA of HigAB toxin-antitoxin module
MKIAGRLAVHDEDTLSRGEQDYLDALTVLIEDHDRNHADEMPSATPLEMLKHFMEEHEMHISDLGRLVGSQSNASLILSGKREISKRVVQILSQHFKVDPGLFIEVSRTESLPSLKERTTLGKDGKMKVELNDDECCIAATALHVQSMESENGIADQETMEDRHWRLEKINECRAAMKKIDDAWHDRYFKVHAKKETDRFVGFAKGPAPRRRIAFEFNAPELQALIWSLECQKKSPARRALLKKLETAENGNRK